MLSDFGTILLFILSGIVLMSVIIMLNKFIRTDTPNEEKNTTYESGEDPIGNANIRFNVRFYVIALLFVLFEVEVLFLFPWSVVFGNAALIEQTNGAWGWYALAEMLIFVLVLVIGLAYAWGKGYLDWVHQRPVPPKIQSPVPDQLYEALNDRYKKRN